jgi:hypothetical protein
MELKKIQEIFNQNVFVIPNYQRGYAWEAEQVADFINDIKDAVDIDEHYTGQIIVASKKQETIGTVSYDVYEVVDGQQRLTTMSIYIQCVCNRLRQLDADPERISDYVVYKGKSILKLSDDNHQFYFDHILGQDKTPTSFANKSQRNLYLAKQQISTHLEHYKNKDKLIAEYQVLMHKFKVNFSVLTSSLEAGLVFETMNDRGIALSQMDKVKNYLIYLCNRMKKPKVADLVNDQYGVVFSELMKVEGSNLNKVERIDKIEDDFLSCSYFLFNGKNFKDSVHHSIKTDFLPKKNIIKKTKQKDFEFGEDLETQRKKIEDLAKHLGKSAKVYASIFNASFKTEEVNNILRRINYLGGLEKHSRLLLSIFLSRNEENTLSVLQLIESMTFRSKRQPNTNELALEIYKKTNVYSIKKIRDDLKEIMNKSCSNKLFSDMMRSIDFYEETKSNYKAKYFFYYYECALAEQIKTDLCLPPFEQFCQPNYKKFEIEHIDPQQPNGRKPLESVNQIGNLTATFNNRLLNNREFVDKKPTFKQSSLCVEKILTSHETWGEQNIKARTTELVKFAVKKWAY